MLKLSIPSQGVVIGVTNGVIYGLMPDAFDLPSVLDCDAVTKIMPVPNEMIAKRINGSALKGAFFTIIEINPYVSILHTS